MEDIPLMHPDAAETKEDVDGLRAQMAEDKRQLLRSQHGDLIDLDNLGDAEMIDAMFYSVFPNWSPWG